MANLPALTPTNFAEALQFAEALAKSTMVPRDFQRNPANILLAVQWGAELGMPPLQALQSIAVINGKPAVYGDAMLALVRGSPLCEDVIERFDGQGDNLTAICEARRKGKAPVVGRFSVSDAKRAGLWGKAGPWTQYPTRMLQMRARGFALRDAFPDVLRGVISAEEAADAPRVAKDVTPQVVTDLDAFAEDATEAAPETQGPANAQTTLGADPAPDRLREEAGEEQQPAAPEGDAPIDAIKPVRLRHGGWDWPRYTDEYIALGCSLPRDRLAEFRAKQAAMFDALRNSDKEQWARANQALAEYEREDAT